MKFVVHVEIVSEQGYKHNRYQEVEGKDLDSVLRRFRKEFAHHELEEPEYWDDGVSFVAYGDDIHWTITIMPRGEELPFEKEWKKAAKIVAKIPKRNLHDMEQSVRTSEGHHFEFKRGCMGSDSPGCEASIDVYSGKNSGYTDLSVQFFQRVNSVPKKGNAQKVIALMRRYHEMAKLMYTELKSLCEE